MATIKYHAGIPPIPDKWRGVVSGLLDSIGMSSLTISSTKRSLASNSASMYNNIHTYGVDKALKLYNANMQQVVKVYDYYTRAGRNQADTVQAMTAKTATLPLPAHCREQNEHFTVFDVPKEYIPVNMRGSFENVMGKNASKLISPIPGSKYYRSDAEPVYHMEFGGVKTETIVKTGGAAVALMLAAAFLLLRR